MFSGVSAAMEELKEGGQVSAGSVGSAGSSSSGMGPKGAKGKGHRRNLSNGSDAAGNECVAAIGLIRRGGNNNSPVVGSRRLAGAADCDGTTSKRKRLLLGAGALKKGSPPVPAEESLCSLGKVAIVNALVDVDDMAL